MFQKFSFPKTGIIAAALGAVALLSTLAACAQAPQSKKTDEVILEMRQAYAKRDGKKLAELLPRTEKHPLHAWAAYWELKNRLETAPQEEVLAFLHKFADTYQEDRLRNDWLLELGKKRDWATFSRELPLFRMRDDREVDCYGVMAGWAQGTMPNAAAQALVRNNWLVSRDADLGCSYAAEQLLAANLMDSATVWHKARIAAENNRQSSARKAVAMLDASAAASVAEIWKNPKTYIKNNAASARTDTQKQLLALALLRVNAAQCEDAAGLLSGEALKTALSEQQREVLWGFVGKWSALRLSPKALEYFKKAGKTHLPDDQLAWKARAALRAQKWNTVQSAIAAMSEQARRESAWVYWDARATMELQASAEEAQAARDRLAAIAVPFDYYGQLAMEELGQRVTTLPPPPPLTDAEREEARRNRGLNRALYAIMTGMRSEGVREWNYTTNLHTPGGMNDRQLLAAAALACQYQVLDRCINTSMRTRGFADLEQRFPKPFFDEVDRRATEIGLETAYVYGLIRQESRFIMDARSSAGASGLMQIMPATARWTAKKIGLTDYKPGKINDRETNLTIGTAYLKLALDDMDGSMPLAAAAYNAGPRRARIWRDGPVLEGAIWVENIPYNETRDYVKQVLSNTTTYAALIGAGQPQGIKSRLGSVGPRTNAEPMPDMP